ncbi:hypothetical protein HDA44_004834 [Kribbella solani]|uniref:Uncharacterized protein n=1 Tax=Kribbella solani TaxID=236067 RepID=A0A841DS80_9ACTN|nr:hypothetical protein [Kribbella solani]
MHDQIDVQPVRRDSEAADHPGQAVREYGRSGELV